MFNAFLILQVCQSMPYTARASGLLRTALPTRRSCACMEESPSVQSTA